MMLSTIVMIEGGTPADSVKQAAETALAALGRFYPSFIKVQAIDCTAACGKPLVGGGRRSRQPSEQRPDADHNAEVIRTVLQRLRGREYYPHPRLTSPNQHG